VKQCAIHLGYTKIFILFRIMKIIASDSCSKGNNAHLLVSMVVDEVRIKFPYSGSVLFVPFIAVISLDCRQEGNLAHRNLCRIPSGSPLKQVQEGKGNQLTWVNFKNGFWTQNIYTALLLGVHACGLGKYSTARHQRWLAASGHSGLDSRGWEDCAKQDTEWKLKVWRYTTEK